MSAQQRLRDALAAKVREVELSQIDNLDWARAWNAGRQAVLDACYQLRDPERLLTDDEQHSEPDLHDHCFAGSCFDGGDPETCPVSLCAAQPPSDSLTDPTTPEEGRTPVSEPLSPETTPLRDDLERAADTFATRAMPVDPDSALLDQVEFARFVYLLALLNDASVTQLDTEEADDLDRLFYKITHDGEDQP